jgi:hypothetical protein
MQLPRKIISINLSIECMLFSCLLSLQLSTVLEMETLQRQTSHTRSCLECSSLQINLFSALLFHHLSSSLMAINFVRISPTGSVPSTLPLTDDDELQGDLSKANTYEDVDLQHWHILNAIYRRLTRPGRTELTTGSALSSTQQSLMFDKQNSKKSRIGQILRKEG